MTWINTPRKIKKNFPKKISEDGQPLDEPREDESETEEGN